MIEGTVLLQGLCGWLRNIEAPKLSPVATQSKHGHQGRSGETLYRRPQ